MIKQEGGFFQYLGDFFWERDHCKDKRKDLPVQETFL